MSTESKPSIEQREVEVESVIELKFIDKCGGGRPGDGNHDPDEYC